MLEPANSQRLLVVTAHPDDESFGLGAIIDRFASSGSTVRVLSLTRGEASTLGAHAELGAQRELELAAACDALGVRSFEVCDFPDSALSQVEPTVLRDRVRLSVAAFKPDLILTFDPLEGVTGHPDHSAATRAAVTVAHENRIPVLGWALPMQVAATVNAEFNTALAGYTPDDLDHTLRVDRDVQMRAVREHTSQAVPGSLLWRRLELLGDREYLREL